MNAQTHAEIARLEGLIRAQDRRLEALAKAVKLIYETPGMSASFDILLTGILAEVTLAHKYKSERDGRT